MKIYNIEEHLNCYCYDQDEKPMVELRKIKNMARGEVLFSQNEIALIMEGRLTLSLSDNPEKEFHKGQMVFLPATERLHYRALEKSRLLSLRMEERTFPCHIFSLERLYDMMDEVEKPESLSSLEMNARLLHFAQEMNDTVGDGLKCRMYLQTRISAFLILIRSYYPSEQLCRFFYSILSPNTLFSEQVRINYLKYRTINDLAGSMNMTPQQFTRRFTSVFGRTPHDWMQQEKARLIYGEICKSNKSFKEIANQYGFSAQTYFNRFCQTAFAMSPTEIRNKKM